MRVRWRAEVAGVLFVLVALSGCVTGDSSCSCASVTSFEGRSYGEVASIEAGLGAKVGETDPVRDCCGTRQRPIPVYAVDGIDPGLVIAARRADPSDQPALYTAGVKDLDADEKAQLDEFIRAGRD